MQVGCEEGKGRKKFFWKGKRWGWKAESDLADDSTETRAMEGESISKTVSRKQRGLRHIKL